MDTPTISIVCEMGNLYFKHCVNYCVQKIIIMDIILEILS